MLEIELKAHVKNREALIEKLKTFAEYEQTVLREDTYYRFYRNENDSNHITARIRKETKETEKGSQITYYLTYKKKEMRTNSKGIQSEINEENECVISDAKPVEILLLDTGFKTHLKKTKKVIDFAYQTEFGKAEYEICTVERLGDFVEIEILSEPGDEAKISKIQETLKKLLLKTDIPLDQIENRYYSEMLLEISGNADNQ